MPTPPKSQTFTETSALRVDSTTAPVEVRASTDDTITVTVHGDSSYQQSVTIERVGGAVQIREDNPAGQISIGNVTISGGDVVVVGSGTSMATSFGRRGVTSIVAGGRVIVNGVDVTAAVNQTPADAEDRRIEVTAPRGTNIGIDHALDVTITSINGKVRGTLAGRSKLAVAATTGILIKASGQSTARIIGGTGDADIDLSGQSAVVLDGTWTHLEVDVSGQSSLDARGTYQTVSGGASGMSRVTVASGQGSIRTSGMSTATVSGQSGPTRRGQWDF